MDNFQQSRLCFCWMLKRFSPYLISYEQIISQFSDIVYFPNVNSQLQKTGRLKVFAVETNQITLFTLVITVSSWTIKQTQQSILDKNYFSYSKQMNITDVTFAEYTEDNLQFYQIILTEFNHGIFWLDAFVKIIFQLRIAVVMHQLIPRLIITYRNNLQLFIQLLKIYQLFHYKMTVNSVVSTTLEQRYQYVGYQNFSTWGQSISFRNITPVDNLTSLPQIHSVLYFNTGNRIVHTIDQNKLQSCDLYNYKLSIE
ncbi:unnamed protein product (macronuclear) [Paramecium tetraurelia]|uniref:Transmembrane protein n=1 Tax=Paramecium tetraurelia TaxID=5888 RepID=A0BI63_PARTE|nr:uncharacterized protein GSPATT00029266001 [Paramecium tetraurelia]CAK58230.1 unnamed protein product [Paramecium tetraurelia]|eukprot:XP_001425628.1 hypothetical protein (macronuclear) [Paramecium tetraurelia strain d4-2]